MTRPQPTLPLFTAGNDHTGSASVDVDTGTETAPETLPDEVPDCPFCADLPHSRAAHCRTCHASWTRITNSAHCSICHCTFSTPGVFDKHLKRIDVGGCNPPATVTKRNGERVYADPTPNMWNTPVWHQTGERPQR